MIWDGCRPLTGLRGLAVAPARHSRASPQRAMNRRRLPTTSGPHRSNRSTATLFEERHLGYGVYCGASSSTRDHAPSKILLAKPLPANMPVVEACERCNIALSSDEEYVAASIECVVNSTVELTALRSEISSSLQHTPALHERLRAARTIRADGRTAFLVEYDRVNR